MISIQAKLSEEINGFYLQRNYTAIEVISAIKPLEEDQSKTLFFLQMSMNVRLAPIIATPTRCARTQMDHSLACVILGVTNFVWESQRTS